MSATILGAEDFRRQFGVSRETVERLESLESLLLTWNARINLIARDSARHLWQRHIADSAQLWALRAPGAATWADLGAGAGFPGIVIAIMAAEDAPALRMTLVESDQRKAVFLTEAARHLGIPVRVLDRRIEALDPLDSDILSARALAPLTALLDHAEKHRAPGGMGLFPKGRGVHKELRDAATRWRFEHRIHPSLTDPEAAIVEIGALSRV